MHRKIGLFSLSGYNPRALVAFCRFAASEQRTVHLWARDGDDSIFWTDYRKWVCGIRRGPELDLNELIEKLRHLGKEHSYQQIVILPITEYLNRFLLKNRSALEAAGAIIPLVSEKEYIRLSDKALFRDLCIEHRLKVPEDVNPVTDSLPMVAKLKRYSPGEYAKPVFLLSPKDLADFLQTNRTDNFYFQRFIAGQSHYLFFSMDRSGNTFRASQTNLIQQAGGRSMVAARLSNLAHGEVADLYVKMFKGIGFHGLVMVEIMESHGNFYMIEANPRPWGPLQLMVDAGGGILGHHLNQYGFDFRVEAPPRPEAGDPICYFWSGGISQDVLSGQKVSCYGETKLKDIISMPEFSDRDIYKRTDTIKLYEREASGIFS